MKRLSYIEEARCLKVRYKSVCVEVKRICNVKCVVVPVLSGATGMGAEGGGENWEVIPGKHSVD